MMKRRFRTPRHRAEILHAGALRRQLLLAFFTASARGRASCSQRQGHGPRAWRGPGGVAAASLTPCQQREHNTHPLAGHLQHYRDPLHWEAARVLSGQIELPLLTEMDMQKPRGGQPEALKTRQETYRRFSSNQTIARGR